MKKFSSITSAAALAFAGLVWLAPTPAAAQQNGSTGNAESAPTRGGQVETFKVLAWNLEHFVDPFNDPYIDATAEDRASTKKDEVMMRLIEVLKEENADIMVFTEVESDRAIKLMLDTFWENSGHRYFASVPSLEWYQNVVITSRYPIGAITSFREKEMYNPVLGTWENKYNSRLLMAEVQIDSNYKTLVTALHLKAGSDPEDPVWRKEQIRMIDEHFARESTFDPDVNVVVTGDMNFEPDTDEYQMMLDGGGFTLEDPFAPLGHPATHPSHSPSRQIDHVFVSKSMMPEYVEGSARVLNGEMYDTISDHLPVVAEFYAENK